MPILVPALRRTLRLATAFIATITAPSFVAAQSASPAIGTWNIEWEMGRANINGESNPIMATATLKIVADGDSLLATLTTTSRSDGQPIRKPTITFGGRRTDHGASLVQIGEATINSNGDERKQRSVSTWMLEVQGDALTGQIKRDVEGLDLDIPPATVKGSRAP